MHTFWDQVFSSFLKFSCFFFRVFSSFLGFLEFYKVFSVFSSFPECSGAGAAERREAREALAIRTLLSKSWDSSEQGIPSCVEAAFATPINSFCDACAADVTPEAAFATPLQLM